MEISTLRMVFRFTHVLLRKVHPFDQYPPCLRNDLENLAGLPFFITGDHSNGIALPDMAFFTILHTKSLYSTSGASDTTFM